MQYLQNVYPGGVPPILQQPGMLMALEAEHAIRSPVEALPGNMYPPAMGPTPEQLTYLNTKITPGNVFPTYSPRSSLAAQYRAEQRAMREQSPVQLPASAGRDWYKTDREIEDDLLTGAPLTGSYRGLLPSRLREEETLLRIREEERLRLREEERCRGRYPDIYDVYASDIRRRPLLQHYDNHDGVVADLERVQHRTLRMESELRRMQAERRLLLDTVEREESERVTLSAMMRDKDNEIGKIHPIHAYTDIDNIC